MDKSKFVEEINKVNPSSTFLSILGYKNSNQEVSNFSIVFHVSYENALRKSIKIVEAFNPTTPLELQAKEEVLESLNKSLTNPKETNYKSLGNGVRELNGEVYLHGFLVHKRVIESGDYKEKNSKPLTIEKNKIRDMCPVSKFRQFKITPDKVDLISVQGLHLLPPQEEV